MDWDHKCHFLSKVKDRQFLVMRNGYIFHTADINHYYHLHVPFRVFISCHSKIHGSESHAVKHASLSISLHFWHNCAPQFVEV
jgi:hypothetical protein